jgi:hypothetical protein
VATLDKARPMGVGADLIIHHRVANIFDQATELIHILDAV